MRKQLTNVTKECQRLKAKTRQVKKECMQQNTDYQKHKRLAEEHMNHSITFKAKFEEDKDHFEEQIKKMYEVLYAKDEKEKKEENSTEDQQENAASGSSGHRVEILKLRLSKIIATNKEKNRLMTQYLRNVKVLEDAFEQIKETTGITSTDEIVTSFIKAQEQNYSLYNYVNLLGTETDALEESNGEVINQIQSIIQRDRISE